MQILVLGTLRSKMCLNMFRQNVGRLRPPGGTPSWTPRVFDVQRSLHRQNGLTPLPHQLDAFRIHRLRVLYFFFRGPLAELQHFREVAKNVRAQSEVGSNWADRKNKNKHKRVDHRRRRRPFWLGGENFEAWQVF